MICEARSDCQFCDLWLAGFWYGGCVSSGVAMGFVGCKWVLGEVSRVADGCGHGFQVGLRCVWNGS